MCACARICPCALLLICQHAIVRTPLKLILNMDLSCMRCTRIPCSPNSFEVLSLSWRRRSPNFVCHTVLVLLISTLPSPLHTHTHPCTHTHTHTHTHTRTHTHTHTHMHTHGTHLRPAHRGSDDSEQLC